jgi:hypothetical protein
MNDELIFVKTSAGEDAVRDRTRLVQRNLRMVLILVDGLTKVSALKQKAGDPAMIETALSELERIGLIESTDTRGSRQATAVAEALSAAGRVEPSAIDSHDEYPTEDTVFEEIASVHPLGVPTNTTHGAPMTSLPPIGPSSKETGRRADGWFTRMRKRWHQMREERAYEKAYGTPTDNVADVVSTRRVYLRRRIKLKPIIFAIIGGLVVFGVARVVFYPYDEHRPAIEAQLSRMLGDEVTVGSVKLSFVPFPAFKLQRLTVGSDAGVVADTVTLVPDLGFVSGGQLFRSASVTGVEVREKALGKMGNWFLAENMNGVYLDRVDIEGLTLDLGWTRIHGLSGSLKPGPAGDTSFNGRVGQGQLQFEASPGKAGLKVSAKANQWTVPVEPPLAVAALDFSGVLSAGSLAVEKVDARVFDGVVSGRGAVMWGGSSPRMTLDLVLKHVGSAKLLETLQAPILLDGELDGQVQYASAAPSVRWLNQDAKASGTVAVTRGSLKRIDLAGTLRSGMPRSVPRRGGDTGFEDLTGKFNLDAGKIQIADVHLSSGLMLASGQAVVSRESGQITGAANVEMRGSVRAPRALISIGGKAGDPELRPGR